MISIQVRVQWLDPKIDLSNSLTFKYFGFRDFLHDEHVVMRFANKLYLQSKAVAMVLASYQRVKLSFQGTDKFIVNCSGVSAITVCFTAGF